MTFDMGDEQFKVHSETDVEQSNTISDHLLDHTPLSRRTESLTLNHRRSKTVTLSDDFDSERNVEPLSSSPLPRLEDTIRPISIPEENPRVPLTLSVRRRYCTDPREQSKVDSIGNGGGDKVIVTCQLTPAKYSGDTPTRKSSRGEKTISYLSDISPYPRPQTPTPYDECKEERNACEYPECERPNRYHHLFLPLYLLLLVPLFLLYLSGVRLL